MAALKASLLLSLVARLYYLQIIKSKEYKTFSDSNRIKDFLLPPLRGKILDRNGDVFAANKNYYRVLFDPQISANHTKTIIRLADILGVDEAKKQSMLTKLKRHRSQRALPIYEHMSWDEVSKVEVNAPDLPGVSIDAAQIRFFPRGNISSHVIGYMGPVSEKEIAINPLLNHPDFKIGRSGLEKTLENRLRGEAGVKRMEVNAFGLSIRELSREESKAGEDIKTTLDKRLQNFTGERMADLSGSAIVVDVKTGEILTFISTPSFDPNEFTYGVTPKYWKELTQNKDKPLINKPIASQYPPGSTFKMMVTLAALEDGIDPKTKVFCPGYMDLGRTRFRCWKKGGHGHMDMTNAIKHSCNTYFYHTSKKIGVKKIMAKARMFGFGEEVGLILNGEKSGLVPTPDWKIKRYKEKWQVGDTLNVGIGQGYVLATPMQIVMMTARLASGKFITPHLLKSEKPSQEFEKMNIAEEHLSLVREGMRRVINSAGGTAFGSRLRKKKYAMAGKTGTSQVISKKGLEDNIHNMTAEQINRTKNHALFTGFAPLDDPKYAIAVVVEHGGGGSKAAAPVARDIMLKAFEYKVGVRAADLQIEEVENG